MKIVQMNDSVYVEILLQCDSSLTTYCFKLKGPHQTLCNEILQYNIMITLIKIKEKF